MKVIFGKQNAEALGDRIVTLELDTFYQKGLSKPVTAYAVLENDSVPVQEFPTLKNIVEIHNTMMFEYRRKNWDYCRQALEHLKGKFSGTLDSFYDDFEQRIDRLEKENLPKDWSGVVNK